MAKRKLDESLPIAFATQTGFLAALITLFLGTASGTRAWVLLARAAAAFLLVSAISKLIAAGVMHAVRWRANAEPTASQELAETVQTIHEHSRSPETPEKVS